MRATYVSSSTLSSSFRMREGQVQPIFGDQRPYRVAGPPHFAEGASGVEVRLALDRGVDGREASPMVETGALEDF